MAQTERAHWSGRLGFILAASGSAVGLGNIWKFPYVAGENGGGVFVLFYLLCIALVGLPAFIAELRVGQQGQANAVQSFKNLDHAGSKWRVAGWCGLVASFLILSFYSVVGGWVFDFVWLAIHGEISPDNAANVSTLLPELHASAFRQTFWHLFFMAATVFIVLAGVKDGLERYTKILMPVLLGLLMLLFFRSFATPGIGKALEFLFRFDLSSFSTDSLLEAVGHSFFTLSLGMGAILTYGSYLDKKESAFRLSLTVALLDTVIALAAGVIIFSTVFSNPGTEPNSGPGLMFITLPLLFADMDGGQYVALAFFLLVAFAALTSSVSMLEVVVAYWHEQHNVSRKKTALTVGGIIAALGLLSAFSTNVLADVTVYGLTFFDLFDKLTSLFLLPMGGLGISLFFGWKMCPKSANQIFSNPLHAAVLTWLCRIVVPAAVLIVIGSEILS